MDSIQTDTAKTDIIDKDISQTDDAQIDEKLLDKLYELLSQDQFELLSPYDTGRIRLVYLMNDAVESFLVFEDAVMTGRYDEDYEGELEAEVLINEDGRFVLIVHQGESVCTLFFRRLSLEVHPYNYGNLGHVWMKKYEDLRQIEYRIAIMKAKRDYLGDICCSEEEEELSLLEAFPPLNVCSFPAVPRQYYEPREDAHIPTPEATALMQKLAEQAGDHRLARVLERYKKHHGKRETRHIARLLCRNSHSRVVELLITRIADASAMYPDRVFSAEEEQHYARIRKLAERRRKQLCSEGEQVYMFCQTPFLEARDDVEFKAHLLRVRRGLFYRRIQVETF